MARTAGAPAQSRPRQARSKRTRQKILDAALDLLAAGGPSSVTHRAVAERAGVSVGATTYYFSSRVDLLGELHDLHLRRVRERVEGFREAADTTSPPTRAQVVAGLTRYLEQGVHEDRLGSLATFELALERARDPAVRRRLGRATADSNAHAEQMLRELGSRSPELDSTLLIAALNGLRLAWLSQGERSSFAERVPALVDRLVDLVQTD